MDQGNAIFGGIVFYFCAFSFFDVPWYCKLVGRKIAQMRSFPNSFCIVFKQRLNSTKLCTLSFIHRPAHIARRGEPPCPNRDRFPRTVKDSHSGGCEVSVLSTFNVIFVIFYTGASCFIFMNRLGKISLVEVHTP